jgi:hypothetical protein
MPPPLPFPYPIYIGTDICSVRRIARILRGDYCVPFIRRVLAPEELELARHTKPIIHLVLELASNKRAEKLTAAELYGNGRIDMPVWRGFKGWQPSQGMRSQAEEDDMFNDQHKGEPKSKEWHTIRNAAYHMAGRYVSDLVRRAPSAKTR